MELLAAIALVVGLLANVAALAQYAASLSKKTDPAEFLGQEFAAQEF